MAYIMEGQVIDALMEPFKHHLSGWVVYTGTNIHFSILSHNIFLNSTSFFHDIFLNASPPNYMDQPLTIKISPGWNSWTRERLRIFFTLSRCNLYVSNLWFLTTQTKLLIDARQKSKMDKTCDMDLT